MPEESLGRVSTMADFVGRRGKWGTTFGRRRGWGYVTKRALRRERVAFVAFVALA